MNTWLIKHIGFHFQRGLPTFGPFGVVTEEVICRVSQRCSIHIVDLK